MLQDPCEELPSKGSGLLQRTTYTSSAIDVQCCKDDYSYCRACHDYFWAQCRLGRWPEAQPPPPPKLTTVSADRPILLSTATLADFTSWLEAWSDYSRCQHLDLQSKTTRVSALRQALDEDIRRFLSEGTIPTPLDPDANGIIQAVTVFIRRQRNPLLDRISFYNRQQEHGESFDSFLTSLKELQAACDFPAPAYVAGALLQPAHHARTYSSLSPMIHYATVS